MEILISKRNMCAMVFSMNFSILNPRYKKRENCFLNCIDSMPLSIIT